MKKFLIFTDLDGTFLNHEDYSFTDALPALNRLRERNIPVIFTSSKTCAEIAATAKSANVEHPFIYETGCGITWPEGYFTHLDSTEHTLCADYGEITEFLDSLRGQYGFRFNGFHDLPLETIMEVTGLAIDQAKNAKQRRHGEPIQWLDDEARLQQFGKLAEASGYHLVRGGRFIHLMSPVNKSDAIRWLVSQYQQQEPDTQWISIGLGDSPNDLQLLGTVDVPYLVRNLHLITEQEKLLKIEGISQTTQCGAAGWNEAITGLLDEKDQQSSTHQKGA